MLVEAAINSDVETCCPVAWAAAAEVPKIIHFIWLCSPLSDVRADHVRGFATWRLQKLKKNGDRLDGRRLLRMVAFEKRTREVLLMAEILHELIGSFPIIYRVSYIPGGAGFQPSTVVTVCCWKRKVCSKNWCFCFIRSTSDLSFPFGMRIGTTFCFVWKKNRWKDGKTGESTARKSRCCWKTKRWVVSECNPETMVVLANGSNDTNGYIGNIVSIFLIV